MTIHDEFSGTITLTENSSKELLKVLKEQDEEFINDVLDGKCGFTLKSVDGRSVELAPRLDSKADYERGYLRGTKDAFDEVSKTLTQSLKKQFAHLIEDGPQNTIDLGNGFSITANSVYEPQTDWKDEMWAEAIVTEPTSSILEQVDKPQTDYGDFADRLAYERGIKYAWEVAQKVFDSTVTFYEAEYVAKQIADTSQTEHPACDTCQWYNSGIPCGVEPSVCKREVKDKPRAERNE